MLKYPRPKYFNDYTQNGADKQALVNQYGGSPFDWYNNNVAPIQNLLTELEQYKGDNKSYDFGIPQTTVDNTDIQYYDFDNYTVGQGVVNQFADMFLTSQGDYISKAKPGIQKTGTNSYTKGNLQNDRYAEILDIYLNNTPQNDAESIERCELTKQTILGDLQGNLSGYSILQADHTVFDLDHPQGFNNTVTIYLFNLTTNKYISNQLTGGQTFQLKKTTNLEQKLVYNSEEYVFVWNGTSFDVRYPGGNTDVNMNTINEDVDISAQFPTMNFGAGQANVDIYGATLNYIKSNNLKFRVKDNRVNSFGSYFKTDLNTGKLVTFWPEGGASGVDYVGTSTDKDRLLLYAELIPNAAERQAVIDNIDYIENFAVSNGKITYIKAKNLNKDNYGFLMTFASMKYFASNSSNIFLSKLPNRGNITVFTFISSPNVNGSTLPANNFISINNLAYYPGNYQYLNGRLIEYEPQVDFAVYEQKMNSTFAANFANRLVNFANAQSTYTGTVKTIPGYDIIYYHPLGYANITTGGKTYRVTTQNGKIISIRRLDVNEYIYDVYQKTVNTRYFQETVNMLVALQPKFMQEVSKSDADMQQYSQGNQQQQPNNQQQIDKINQDKQQRVNNARNRGPRQRS